MKKKTLAAMAMCLCISAGALAEEKKNPAADLFGDDLVFCLNFEDGKGMPSLMDGEVSLKVSEKEPLQFTDRGIFGKALSGGRCTYLTNFENLDFGKDGSIVYWIALMTDDPAFDARPALSSISLGTVTPAWLLLQRQGWKKSCNMMAVMYIPKKKGPLARIFGVAQTTKWKVAEWHMVTVSWTPSALSIALDDGSKLDQVPLTAPLPVLYGDPAGKITKLSLGVPENTVAVDEIMMFSKKLTQKEISELYTQSVKNAGTVQK